MLVEALMFNPEHTHVENTSKDLQAESIADVFDTLKELALDPDIEKVNLVMTTIKGGQVAMEQVIINNATTAQPYTSCIGRGVVIETTRPNALELYDKLTDAFSFEVEERTLDENPSQISFGVRDPEYPDDSQINLITVRKG